MTLLLFSEWNVQFWKKWNIHKSKQNPMTASWEVVGCIHWGASGHPMKHTFGMDGCDRCGKRESTSTRADLWHASSSGVQWKDTEDRERMLYGCRFDFCTWLAIWGGHVCRMLLEVPVEKEVIFISCGKFCSLTCYQIRSINAGDINKLFVVILRIDKC